MIYVSAQRGNDANPGTFAAPLREISKAAAQSPAGETIRVLDSGDYEMFTVTKSLAIVATGVHANVLAPAATYGNTAVTINAGTTDVVVLRGLTIKSTGGTVGVSLSAAKTLRVENCVVSGFASTASGIPGYGISVSHGELTVKDSVLRDNAHGVYFSQASDVRGVIDRSRIEGTGAPNGAGMQVSAGVQVTVSDSLISGHQEQAIYLRGYTGSPIALLSLIRSTITHNRIGIYSDKLAQVHLVSSTVTLNGTGLFTLNGGIIYTAGNNAVIGNLTANVGGTSNVVFFKSDVTGP